MSLFHVQIYKSLQAGQLPQGDLTFLQNLLNFIITKYLKQEINEELSVCVDERSPCGLSKTSLEPFERVYLCPNFMFLVSQ